jgi:hypothetical protein
VEFENHRKSRGKQEQPSICLVACDTTAFVAPYGAIVVWIPGTSS